VVYILYTRKNQLFQGFLLKKVDFLQDEEQPFLVFLKKANFLVPVAICVDVLYG